MVAEVVGVLVKIFVLMAPFFVLSVFAGVTDGMPLRARKNLALRTTAAILILSLALYFIGDKMFWGLGITLDAFRVGAGLVLLLSGLEMVRGAVGGIRAGGEQSGGPDNDPAVVPLATPTAVGPGTIGALLVMGVGSQGEPKRILLELAGIVLAIALIGLMLYYANAIETLLKRRGLAVLSKLTGLFLVALAVQLIAAGIRGLWLGL